MNPVIIIGTGLAGYTLAREFRKVDRESPLHLFTTDDGCFYSKPMLSNALTNNKTPETLIIESAEQMSERLTATIRTQTAVTAIDTNAHHIIVDSEIIPYSKLVLALGAEPIQLPLPDAAISAVLSVNNLHDYVRFRQVISDCERVAIIGPGLIGCEFANDLCNAGKNVTVIGPDTTPLGRLLPIEAGNVLQDALTRIGIKWRLGIVVNEVISHDNGYRLMLSDGTYLDTDVVLSAVGLRPNIRLAKLAGLNINRGIVVNRILETNANDVYALGDCMEIEGLVMPFVMPIMHCARTLAKTLAGQSTRLQYPAMPVAVKTPAYPVLVAPPSPDAVGHWQVTKLNDGVRAEFRNNTNLLLGFALTGSAIIYKQTLINELPPLML